MIRVSIVSADPTLRRLLELEALRLGMEILSGTSPEADCQICLADADGLKVAALPQKADLVLLGQCSDPPLLSLAKAHLDKPVPLEQLRTALCDLNVPKTQKVSKTRAKKAVSTQPPQATLTLYPTSRSASVGSNPPVKLSDIEYKLLCRLREFGARPLGAADAEDILGGIDNNKFTVHICYLRRKLETGNLRLIHTVRGQGYTLIPQERKKS